MFRNIEKAKQFGYWLRPPITGQAIGGYRLEIVLHPNETDNKQGIRSVTLPVESGEGSIESLKVQHPWRFEDTYYVCTGIIQMIDDRGEKIEALTFGGRLKIDDREGYTACALDSPAPILEITEARPVERLFIDEIKILLAERRAERLNESQDYEANLIKADPLELYISLVNTLSERIEHWSHKDDLQIMELINFVHTEQNRLEQAGDSPMKTPRLNEIL